MLKNSEAGGATTGLHQSFASLNDTWKQSLSEIFLMHSQLSTELMASLISAGKLFQEGVLPSRNQQQRKDTLEDTVWNWVQEFVYHLNGFRICVRNSLEDLKHIFEDHKVIKLYLEQSSSVFEKFSEKMELPSNLNEFLQEESQIAATIGTYMKTCRLQQRRSVLNLDPQPHSRNRGMQKLEICQLYKTYYGYISPRVKNPLFFGETQLEEMKKKVLKLEGEISSQTLTITSLRREYQVVEHRLTQTKNTFEQERRTLEHNNQQLHLANSNLQEQVVSLQSSIAQLQAVNRSPLQTKDTLRSRLTTRSSFRGASSQPPNRTTTLDEAREDTEYEMGHQRNTSRAREYFEIIPSEADKSYHSSRENLSTSLKQVQALRELVIKERKMREDLERRLAEKEFSESSIRTGNFNKQIELEDQAAVHLHRTKLEYEARIHDYQSEIAALRVNANQRAEHLEQMISEEKQAYSRLKQQFSVLQSQEHQKEQTIKNLQLEIEEISVQLSKARQALQQAESIRENQFQPSCPPSPAPPRSPVSRLERSASSSPIPRGLNLPLLDMSMNDQLFKTGTCDNCEGGSALSRRLLGDSKREQELSELREKIQAKRNEISLLQERELHQQRAHHTEIRTLQETWTREKGELQSKLSRAQLEKKQLEDTLDQVRLELQTQITASASLMASNTKLKSQQLNSQSADTDLQSAKSETSRLRQLVQSLQTNKAELEALVHQQSAQIEAADDKHRLVTEEFKLLIEKDRSEHVSVIKNLTQKVSQLETVLSQTQTRDEEINATVRQTRNQLHDAEEARDAALRKLSLLKEQSMFVCMKLFDKTKWDVTKQVSDLEGTTTHKIRLLEEKVSRLMTSLQTISLVARSKADKLTQAKRVNAELKLQYERQIKACTEQQEVTATQLAESLKQQQRLKQEQGKQSQQLKERLSTHEAEFTKLMNSLREQKDSEIQHIREQLAQTVKSADQDKRQVQSLLEQVEEEKKQQAKLRSSCESLEASRNLLHQQITKANRDLESAKQEHQSDLQRLKQQHFTESSELKRLLESETQKTKELVTFRAEKDSLLSEKKLLEQKVTDAAQSYQSELSVVREQLKKERDQLRTELTKQEELLRTKQSQIDDMEMDTKHQLRLAGVARTTLEDQLNSEQKKYRLLQEQLATLQNSWESERNQLTMRMAGKESVYQTELAELAAKLEKTKRELEDLGSKSTDQQRLVQVNTKLVEELQALLSMNAEKVSTRDTEIKRLSQLLEEAKQGSKLREDERDRLAEQLKADKKGFADKEGSYLKQITVLEDDLATKVRDFEKRLSDTKSESSKSNQERLDGLQKQLDASFSQQITAKNSQIEDLELQIKRLNNELVECKSDLLKSQNSAKEAEALFTKSMNLLKEEKTTLSRNLELSQTKMTEMINSHSAELSSLRETHQKQLQKETESLKQLHLQEIESLTARHKSEFQSSQDQLKSEEHAKLEAVRQDLTSQIETAKLSQRKLQSEFDTLKFSQSASQSTLQLSLETANSTVHSKTVELEALQTAFNNLKQVEQSLQTTLETEKQAHLKTSEVVRVLETDLATWKDRYTQMETERTLLVEKVGKMCQRPTEFKTTQTEAEVCDAQLVQTQVKTLEVQLEQEKQGSKELKEKFAVDKGKLLEKLAWLEKELARQKDQIMDKLMDIKSLRMSRDQELAHFKISVEEFNKQLEEERKVFNQQLKELDEQKRVQFDMLSKKVLELEDQREKERNLFKSYQMEADQSMNSQDRDMYEKKDTAIKEMIEQYKKHMEKLKIENAELRTENLEAMKSIREFLSRIDPDESPEKLKGFRLPEALERISERVGGSGNKGVNLQLRMGLVRTQSALNIDDPFNDSMGSEMDLGAPRRFTTSELVPGGEGAREMGMMSATTSPLTKRRTFNTQKVIEAMEESDDSEETDAKKEKVLTTEKKFSLEIHEVKTQKFETPRITIYKDSNSLEFKQGRQLADLPLPKRIFKPKFTEIQTGKEAKTKIRSNAAVTQIALESGRN